jgi:hypothetical protein
MHENDVLKKKISSFSTGVSQVSQFSTLTGNL